MAVPASSDLPDDLDAAIAARVARLARCTANDVALAETLDDEIAALEAARRLRVPAESVDFEALLDAVEAEGHSG